MTNRRCTSAITWLVLLLALAGCGDDDTTAGAAAEPQGVCHPAHASILPALTGPYCVGTQAMPLLDTSREEPFTADPNDRREVMVNLFYPIDPETTGVPAPFTDPATFEYLVTDYWVPISPHPDYDNFPSNSLLTAPLAAGRRAFPLLLLSPGLGSVTAMLTTMIENLASHGYIVAAINHPYVSGRTVFPDGRTVANALPEGGLLRVRFPVVVADQQFVLDELERRAASDPLWRGRIDLTRIGSLGHSYGGSTAAEMCLKDQRVRACINYDGTFFGDVAKQGSTKPLMVVLGGNRYFVHPLVYGDNSLLGVIAHQTGPLYLTEVEGALHNGFTTDAALFFNQFPLSSPLASFVGSVPQPRMVEITNAYNLAFFGVHLRGEPGSELTSLVERFSEVRFAAQNL